MKDIPYSSKYPWSINFVISVTSKSRKSNKHTLPCMLSHIHGNCYHRNLSNPEK